ncbi:hypothetical protein [Peribacillus butanolivorans]
MSKYEIVSLIASSLAILISIATYLKSNSIAMGNLELAIRERLSTSKTVLQNSIQQMIPLLSKKETEGLNPAETMQFEAFEGIYKSSIEDNLNAYEEACAKYLDKKVDRKRFKKIYKAEIKQLVENESHTNHFHPTTSRFKAILKVYNKWENLEG